MEKLLIIGAGGLGRMTMEAASNKYECFFVDDAYENGNVICNTTVVGKIKDLPDLVKLYKNAIVAIGNNALRESLTNYIVNLRYDVPSIISDKSYISKYSSIGKGSIILPMSCIQNGCSIGCGAVITSLVEIHHDSKIGNYSLIYSNSTIRTNAIVGNKVKIGSNVSVGNDVEIIDDSIIVDGTVLKK